MGKFSNAYDNQDSDTKAALHDLEMERQEAKHSKMVRDHFIEHGVKSLKDGGYSNATKENILTDKLYVTFFRCMLEDHLGCGYDADINALLAELPKDDIRKEVSI